MFATKGKDKFEDRAKFCCKVTDIWEIPQSEAMSFRRVHQSQKPLELIEKMILNSSHEGDVVLDCFMGSGTTAVAAINTNRHFIGFEIDEKFYNIANERINKALAEREQRLFNMAGEING